ncbi:MAG: NAD(P)H-binding protein [Ignavibacteriaceae bacterium]
MKNKIFITGGTGYIGSRLIPRLLNNGFEVTALVRKGSENKLNVNCNKVIGNPFDGKTFEQKISPADIFIQLVGVPHPSPAKAKQFREIDLISGIESINAAKKSGIKKFIYISVAHPAPIMKEYQEVRKEVETNLINSGLNYIIVRPWYVLGPGHYWAYVLKPAYYILKKLQSTKETAERLDLININQLIEFLVEIIKHNNFTNEIFEVPQIKKILKV